MTRGLSPERAREVLTCGAGARFAVVGDVFLDRYLVGRAERLSREGPVPVLAFRRTFDLPGGAANPARNLATLGATVIQVGVVGDDADGRAFTAALGEAGIDGSGIVVDPSRPTTLKLRVVAEGLAVPQQVARLDRQCRDAVSGAAARELVEAVRRAAAQADAVLLSHYRSGVVGPAVRDAARLAAAGRSALLAADAQGDLPLFRGFDVVRVGRQDAGRTLTEGIADESQLEQAVVRLRSELGARVLLLGRGAEGMTLADEDGVEHIRPANVSEVFDVAGAGDSVIAVATLSMVGGATAREAARLANLAAGVVVRRLGVAAPTVTEIVSELERARDVPD